MTGPQARAIDAERRWHSLPAGEVAELLGSDLARGLSSTEATRRLASDGPNRLPESRPPGPLTLVLHQFQSFLVYVLLFAAVLSLLLGDVVECAAIIVIAVLNASLGFLQEHRAEQALTALKSLAAPMAAVVRDGAHVRIPSADVVPGDVLQIEAGDLVAADARLIEAASLALTEAVLTGESTATDKGVAAVDADADVADRASMVFQGTTVARGHGTALTVATGAATEIGKIAAHVAGQKREETPLQADLATVGRYLAAAAAILCFVVFITGLLSGIAIREMLLTSTSLAVAAIPEGLPAAATIILALGVQRMAARNVIIRRLSSVETLGSVTVIFTDKTGTLTVNDMRVQEVWAPHGEAELIQVAVLCNNATLADGEVAASGDPTEVALLAWARDRGADIGALQQRYQREDEIPFEAERARMTVKVREGDRSELTLTKGAPETLIARSVAHDGFDSQEVLSRSEAMAAAGMRVLAFARKELRDEDTSGALDEDLRFVGLIGMADPLRDEAPDAVEQAGSAGIRVVMLTGDQPATARSIAARVGLAGAVVSGREIERLDPPELAALLRRTAVFARVTSEHKMRIIEASRQGNDIVAMTGDGVNDAPALQAADIGVAMGKVGTDVARQASDMVLTDDNFSSIVAAVEEGRTIHANIRRFTHFLLACNTAEILVVFLAVLVAGEAVLSPLQILFVNLVTDGLPALALGVEPATRSIMRQRPRKRGNGILTPRSLTPILGMGGVVAASTLLAYALGSRADGRDLASHLALATLVGSQLSASLVFRSETESVFQLRPNTWLLGAIALSLLALLAIFLVAPLRDTFDTEPLSVSQWLLVAGLSLIPLAAGEAAKRSGLLARFHLLPEELEEPVEAG